MSELLHPDYWYSFRLTTNLAYAINENRFRGNGFSGAAFETLLDLLLELGFDLVWDVDIPDDSWWDEDEFYYFIRQFASLEEFIAIGRKIPHDLILSFTECDDIRRCADFEIYDDWRE